MAKKKSSQPNDNDLIKTIQNADGSLSFTYMKNESSPDKPDPPNYKDSGVVIGYPFKTPLKHEKAYPHDHWGQGKPVDIPNVTTTPNATSESVKWADGSTSEGIKHPHGPITTYQNKGIDVSAGSTVTVHTLGAIQMNAWGTFSVFDGNLWIAYQSEAAAVTASEVLLTEDVKLAPLKLLGGSNTPWAAKIKGPHGWADLGEVTDVKFAHDAEWESVGKVFGVPVSVRGDKKKLVDIFCTALTLTPEQAYIRSQLRLLAKKKAQAIRVDFTFYTPEGYPNIYPVPAELAKANQYKSLDMAKINHDYWDKVVDEAKGPSDDELRAFYKAKFKIYITTGAKADMQKFMPHPNYSSPGLLRITPRGDIDKAFQPMTPFLAKQLCHVITNLMPEGLPKDLQDLQYSYPDRWWQLGVYDIFWAIYAKLAKKGIDVSTDKGNPIEVLVRLLEDVIWGPAA